MNALLTIVLAVQILTALGMIGLILLQHGKGADMGAAFGSGASGSLFGASGSANFLSRTTAVLAGVFFVCTLALAYFSHSVGPASSGSSVLERGAPLPVAPATPPSPANQIPGGGTPVPAQQGPATTPATPASVGAGLAPVAPASGAGQIPTR
ncbi:preprotein translocase subunit SecG [Ramlibacter sp.]|uniref:preprotein translocase subunit SecG n=1 Tax=Ramlibacter sp. TaxID=1917967 RepID=UPI00262ED9FB|nr:preprotein translocase subunit SecG [Ramlibacter sp.]MDB5956295.1 putative preprotein translocase, subunit SecG [Ramlibacter sp.]